MCGRAEGHASCVVAASPDVPKWLLELSFEDEHGPSLSLCDASGNSSYLHAMRVYSVTRLLGEHRRACMTASLAPVHRSESYAVRKQHRSDFPRRRRVALACTALDIGIETTRYIATVVRHRSLVRKVEYNDTFRLDDCQFDCGVDEATTSATVGPGLGCARSSTHRRLRSASASSSPQSARETSRRAGNK